MNTLHNLLITTTLYIYEPIHRSTFNIVNGKFKPVNSNHLSDALNIYELISKKWGFVSFNWSSRLVNDACRHNIIQYRKFFEKYPISEWNVSKITDNTILQKWTEMCEVATIRTTRENGFNDGWTETRTRIIIQ